MRFTRLIRHTFGKERAALYEAEVEHLAEHGYARKEVGDFLETYALSLGIYDLLSMLSRSKLSVGELEKSLVFLLNRHTTITESLSKVLKPSSRILDVGCGRGLVTCSLALKGFEVHGVDISEGALKIAEKLACKLKCKPTFRLAELDELPFPSAYFEAALCIWTLHEIPHDRIRKLLKELHRIVCKMGSVYIIDQEGVTPMEIVKNAMSQSGFRLESEESILSVYDHGKTSKALMLGYVRL